MVAVARVQAVFQGGGAAGFPEDRVVNTFHFRDAGRDQDALYEEECRLRVSTFFTAETTGSSIGGFLSPWLSRTATVQSYDMSLPPGSRVPTAETFTLPATGGFAGLPEEVALVATLKGDPPDTARRRGRLYLGPFNLNTLAFLGATATTPARPVVAGAQSLTQVIRDRCVALATIAAGFPAWCIRSTVPSENYVTVTNGHVDNAWDTQRRRGPETTARTVWTSP
jgi:hypothetical protein